MKCPSKKFDRMISVKNDPSKKSIVEYCTNKQKNLLFECFYILFLTDFQVDGFLNYFSIFYLPSLAEKSIKKTSVIMIMIINKSNFDPNDFFLDPGQKKVDSDDFLKGILTGDS